MARYILIALNGPTPGEGDEQTYNQWYDDVHLPDLLQITGVQSARRYKVERGRRADWPYAAVYEIETDDADALMHELSVKPRPFTTAFDGANSSFMLARQI